jgi:SMC interacting uncharacterized protein involved in chromosome segregation
MKQAAFIIFLHKLESKKVSVNYLHAPALGDFFTIFKMIYYVYFFFNTYQ